MRVEVPKLPYKSWNFQGLYNYILKIELDQAWCVDNYYWKFQQDHYYNDDTPSHHLFDHILKPQQTNYPSHKVLLNAHVRMDRMENFHE